MAGTRAGGLKAAKKNIELYGEDYYVVNGRKGGLKGTTGGFGQGEVGRQRARIYGKIGGKISKRGKSKKG